MVLTQDIADILFDYLDICPHATVLEVSAVPSALLAEAAQKRSISYGSFEHAKGQEADCILYITRDHPPNNIACKPETRTIILGSCKWPFLSYVQWRIRTRAKEIIRIQPASEIHGLYMSSTNFIETFKRTYREANLNVIGKILVALKVTFKPACFYPLYVFVL